MKTPLIDGRHEFRRLLSAHPQEAGHHVQALPGLRPGLAWLESHCPNAVMVERGLLLRQGEPLLLGVVRHFHPPAALSAPFEPEDPEPAEVTEQMDRMGRVSQQAGEAVGAVSARPSVGELVIDRA